MWCSRSYTQEEADRQSFIANKSISATDLSAVERDSNYQESKLLVKLKQGMQAHKAFDRERRVPALVIGGLMFASGVPLVALPIFFGAPMIFRDVGFIVLEPGLTIAFLSLLSGDDWIIDKVMKFLVGFDHLFMPVFLIPLVATFRASRFVQDGICLDYRGMSVPCWCSTIQCAMLLLMSLWHYEISVRRICVNLYTRRNVGGRLELLWGLWVRYLVGYAVLNVAFISPYLFFSEGRMFVSSFSGVVLVLSILETALFAKLASTESWRSGLQQWFTQFGTVTTAMAVAALVSHDGASPEEVVISAKKKLRCVQFSSMNSCDFDSASRSEFAKSMPCEPGDVDLFISHSWRDPPRQKWDVLKNYCEKFKREVHS